MDGREMANVAGELHEQILRQLLTERDDSDPSATMAARLERLRAAGLVTDSEVSLLHDLAEVFLHENDAELSEMCRLVEQRAAPLLGASPVAVAIAKIAVHAMDKERRALDEDIVDPTERAAAGFRRIPVAEKFCGPVETATAMAIAGAAAASGGGQLVAVIGAILGASIACSMAFSQAGESQ